MTDAGVGTINDGEKRPLVPAECDLRDFPKIMIDIGRLFASTFNASASRNPLAWMVGHKLWYRSWHQVPAASLPVDEEDLCHLAELGLDVKRFRAVKTIAMRGWIECSDGRLYHPVVAEAALEAWLRKLAQRVSSGAGNAKKYGNTFDPSPIEAQINVAIDLLNTLNPQSKAIPKARRKPSQPPPAGRPDGNATGSQETGTVPLHSNGEFHESAQPIDLSKSLFDQGVCLLTQQGRSEASARSFIAQCQRDFGDAATFDALQRSRTATNIVSAMKDRLGKAKRQAEYLGP